MCRSTPAWPRITRDGGPPGLPRRYQRRRRPLRELLLQDHTRHRALPRRRPERYEHPPGHGPADHRAEGTRTGGIHQPSDARGHHGDRQQQRRGGRTPDRQREREHDRRDRPQLHAEHRHAQRRRGHKEHAKAEPLQQLGQGLPHKLQENPQTVHRDPRQPARAMGRPLVPWWAWAYPGKLASWTPAAGRGPFVTASGAVPPGIAGAAGSYVTARIKRHRR